MRNNPKVEGGRLKEKNGMINPLINVKILQPSTFNLQPKDEGAQHGKT